MAAPFALSPSALARYFFHDCDRFLRFRSTRNPATNGIPVRENDAAPVMAAVLASGESWEEEVVANYVGDRARIAPGIGRLSARYWSVEQSIALLREAKVGEFLYQVTLSAPDELYGALGLDPNLVEIRNNRPDLVQVVSVGGSRRFRVVDVKRGAALRLPYRMQILFYALELDHLVRRERIEGSVDLELGAAWLGGASEPAVFDLAVVRPHLEDLFARLPHLLSQAPEDVSWHLRFRCEWCEYLDHCRNEMVARDDVSRLVGISAHGKRFLARELDVRTLPALGRALDDPTADATLARCASLAGERPRLESRLSAYATEEPERFGSIHPALPRGEDVAVFVTVQSEPVGDRTWLLGMSVDATDEIRRNVLRDTNKPKPFVVLARTADECSSIRERFIVTLHQVLVRVDLWNRQHSEWRDKLSVQLYCYSELERDRLLAVLMEALCEPRLVGPAMALLFHLQAPDLLLVDDHPREVAPHPIIALVSALGRILALPVDVAYTLPESLAALGSDLQYRRRDRFHYPFGHALRSDDVLLAWSGEEVNLGDVLREAASRLSAYCEVLRGIRNRAADQLVAWPPKHALAVSSGIRHPRLSRLAFFARYESVLSCLSIRASRCDSRQSMAANGKLVPMKHTGDGAFSIEAPNVVLEASEFTRWLVVRDSADGLRAQAQFNDWAHRGRFQGGQRGPNVGVGRLAEVTASDLGFANEVRVQWDRLHEPGLEIGAQVLLMPRFMDFNTGKLLDGIARLDDGGGLFIELLDSSSAVGQAMDLSEPLATLLAEELSRHHLTPSQSAAWRAISTQRVTAVWGPPGTGKTHFLASLIVGMAESHRRAGLSFHVLVAAMTHAAIENLIRKLHSRTEDLGSDMPALAKVGAWQGDAVPGASTVEKDGLDEWLRANEIAVVGSTVWGVGRSDEHYDLVVIDEASQMKLPEAALAIEHVRASGRLVAAGDHQQLSPIMVGAYPDPPDGEPALHGSVFDLLRERPGRAGAPVCQLLENWRMNDVLTGASRVLYGPAYTTASTEVARRRLQLRTMPPGLVCSCLDPAWPLVIAILSGVQAGRANEVEAGLISQLTHALRDSLEPPVADDQEFWTKRLFIVSPHHAQIHAIRQALSVGRAWGHRPFVDTVDKMQGQEADAVFISYGVADPEFAVMEAEFVYGRNRLNVAITRARSKSVMFLPRPLLDASPELLDSPTVAEGLGYMRGLVQLGRRHGDVINYDLGTGAALEIVRLGVEVNAT